MTVQQKHVVNVRMGGGLLLGWTAQTAEAFDLFARIPFGQHVFGLLTAAAFVLMFWGFSTYAKAKGYHPAVGVVLGAVVIVGWLALVALPDRGVNSAAAPPAGS